MHLPAYFRRDPQEPKVRLVRVEDGGGARGQVMVIEPARRPRPPELGFPRVEDVADTRAGQKSRQILAKYGLPAYARWGLPSLEEVRKKRCEIPLKTLEDVARRALLIAYARQAVRGDYEPLRKVLNALSKRPDFLGRLGQHTTEVLSRQRASTVELDWAKEVPKTDAAYGVFASGNIWLAMNEAFDDLVPVVHIDTEGRPVLGFYARGWWALMVMNALQPRPERGEGGYCEAVDCWNFVPPGPQRYCSSRCRERAKKQRLAAYRELTEE